MSENRYNASIRAIEADAQMPSINQVFRDKYPGQENRTIRITEVFPNCVKAVVLTDAKGERPNQTRYTQLKLSTLRGGYTPVVEL